MSALDTRPPSPAEPRTRTPDDSLGPDRLGEPLTVAPRPGARVSAWLAVLAVLAALVVDPLWGTDFLGTPAFARVVEGQVEVQDGGSWRVLGAGSAVPVGATLRAVDGGTRLRTPAGDLRLSQGAVLATLPDVEVELQRGSVLYEVTGAAGIRLGAVQARGAGTFRADVGAASRLAVYHGRILARDGVTQRPVGRLEQATVRDGAVAADTVPLRYLATDPWDAELLAPAIAVDRLVAGSAASLAAVHGNDPQLPAFYADFGPAGIAARAGELAAVVRAGRVGPPAEVLVGMAVVDALVVEGGAATGAAVDRVVALRRAGATWGLVLLYHDLGTDALRAALDRIITRGEDAGTVATPAVAPGTGSAADRDEGATGAPSPDAPDTVAPALGTLPGPGSPPAGDDDGRGGGNDDGDSPAPLAPISDALEDTGGLLDDLLDTTGDAVGDTTETVADLIDARPAGGPARRLAAGRSRSIVSAVP